MKYYKPEFWLGIQSIETREENNKFWNDNVSEYILNVISIHIDVLSGKYLYSLTFSKVRSFMINNPKDPHALHLKSEPEGTIHSS
jgi:hypothetical protein